MKIRVNLTFLKITFFINLYSFLQVDDDEEEDIEYEDETEEKEKVEETPENQYSE